MIFRPARFRPGFSRVLTVAVAALAGAALVGLQVEGSVAELLRYGAIPLLAAALCWAAFWAPELRVEEHAVVVRNVFATHHVPWPAIERIDTKYALTLHTRRRRVPVWVAPAPSRLAVMSMTAADVRHTAESARAAEGSIRPGDAASTFSGAAARSVRTRWEQLRDDGLLDPGPARQAAPPRAPGGAVDAHLERELAVRTEWHTGTILLLAALAAASAAGITL